MKFTDVMVSREEQFSVGVEEESGRHYISVPVSHGLVYYEEYFEIDLPTFERYCADPESAREFVARCDRREMDDRLIFSPTKSRGMPPDQAVPPALTDPERVAAIEEGLADEDDEEVFSALVDIGKYGHREMIDRVVPYLTSQTDFLREAAVRTLVFYFHLPEYKAEAIRLLDSDPDEGVRQVAAMGLRMFAEKDPELLQHLLAVALSPSEEDVVRNAAFISALVASGGIERSEFPLNADWLPGFEAQADWPLLERALRKGGIPVPPGVSERAARQR
ncbi:MAG TPA: HEAT repeat domain-containing protein [Nocardioides sp.]|nr:HEAT repeat domain-containing protein [Nocardioides sp.]